MIRGGKRLGGEVSEYGAVLAWDMNVLAHISGPSKRVLPERRRWAPGEEVLASSFAIAAEWAGAEGGGRRGSQSRVGAVEVCSTGCGAHAGQAAGVCQHGRRYVCFHGVGVVITITMLTTDSGFVS